MTETAETALPANKKVRADDARGTPPGAGAIVPAHGGRIGNPPFIPTEAQRAKVRELAKVFPQHAQAGIARLIGVSRDTLQRHFRDDLDLGRIELQAALGTQMVNLAMNASAVDGNGKPLAKGDIDALKFCLARLCGWTTRIELNAPAGGGGSARPGQIDLSRLNAQQLQEYGRLSAIAEGLDPDLIIATPIDA